MPRLGHPRKDCFAKSAFRKRIAPAMPGLRFFVLSMKPPKHLRIAHSICPLFCSVVMPFLCFAPRSWH